MSKSIFNAVNLSSSIEKPLADLPTFRLTDRISKNYDKIKKICQSALIGSEYKFGHHSLEYVSTLAALMDINAIFGRFEEDIIRLSDFECLSDRTKEIFINYFEKHVQSRPQ